MQNLIQHSLGHGITCIDAQYVRPGLASCYLIEQNGHAAFIDVGTNHTVPLLLTVLEQKGIPLGNIDYVIPTHVHLDHAGGAGLLMQHAPNAQLIIHPRGARHMVDPSRLQAGATAVYGDAEFKRHYGELIGIDEQRVVAAADHQKISFQSRKLEFLHTPGHAKHHFCIIDKTSNGMFTGDTFGAAYPELTVNQHAFVFPPTSPVDFNPSDWLDSIDKLMATGCDRAYLTHYNQVGNLESLANDLRKRIRLFAQLSQQSTSDTMLYEKIEHYLVEEVVTSGCRLTKAEIIKILSLDIGIIVQGLRVWLEKNA